MASNMNLSWGQDSTSILIGFPIFLLFPAGAAAALATYRGVLSHYARFASGPAHEDGDDAMDAA